VKDGERDFIWSLTLSLLMSYIYGVSQEECARLRESVPYVKLY